jgi:hypothetical protein
MAPLATLLPPNEQGASTMPRIEITLKTIPNGMLGPELSDEESKEQLFKIHNEVPGTVYLPWITFNGGEFVAARLTDA